LRTPRMLPDNGAPVPAVWYAAPRLYRRLRFFSPRDGGGAAVFAPARRRRGAAEPRKTSFFPCNELLLAIH